MKKILFAITISLMFISCSSTHKVKVFTSQKMVMEQFEVKRKQPNLKSGSYSQFYKNTKITEGFYSNNQKTGLWKFFDVEGKVNFSGEYSVNKKHGKWIYYQNDTLSSEIYYRNGEVDSVFGYYPDGNLAYELRHLPNKTSVSKSYFENGQLKESITLLDKKINQTYKLYFENGQLHREIEFKEGNPFSVISTFDLKGNPIDGGTLKNGNGNLIAYHFPKKTYDTELLVSYTEIYENGLKNGIYRSFSKEGKIEKEVNYKDGQVDGAWKIFENGAFKRFFNYNQGEVLLNRTDDFNLFYTFIDAATTLSSFQGGESELLNFMNKNTNYPKTARSNNTQGYVVVNFVVSITGELTRIKAITEADEELIEEALRVTQIMPRWNPGFEHRVPVRISYNLPFRFTIK